MCDYDMPAVYSDTERRAAKYHRCYECKGVIRPGERYRCHRGCWEGEWATYRVCADCTHLRCELGDECSAFGQLAENLYEVDRAKFSAYREHRLSVEYAPGYWARYARESIAKNWHRRHDPARQKFWRFSVRNSIARARRADQLLKELNAEHQVS